MKAACLVRSASCDRSIRFRRMVFPGLWACVLLFLVAAPAAAQTRTNFWTGAAEEDNHWSTAGNWSLAEIPAEGDRVVFGNEPGGVAQVITLDVEPTIHELWISTTNTAYTINAADDERITLTGSTYAIRMTDETTVAPVLNTRMHFSAGAEGRINNDSLEARLVLGPVGVITASFSSTYYGFAGAGLIESRATIGNRPRFRGNVILNPDAGNATASHVYLGHGSTLLLATNADMGGRFERITGKTEANLAIIDSGPADRTLSIQREHVVGQADTVLVFADSPDGSSGHLTLKLYHMRENSMWFDTSANSTVELSFFAPSPAAGASILAADNPGIGGAGNMRLKRNDPSHPFGIARAMTYTGRTMLDTGILQLNAGGALPTNTIVEIGEDATLDLNGIDQTVGGLTDWTGLDQTNAPSAGSVALGGAALTLDAAQASSFGGQVTGTGTLVKAGAETVTLSAGYTNAADRVLRVAGGVLAVTGALSVEEGTFELAGGRITAGSLASEDTTWNVTLFAENEGQVLVEIAVGADLTGAELVLALAGGYTPEVGKTFTLLAADSISGATQGGALFNYTDGEVIQVDGVPFAIDWVTGSENIVLTAIPEPGSIFLLMLALAGTWSLLRRRRV